MPEQHPLLRFAADVGAAVLVASFCGVIVACSIVIRLAFA